MRVVSLAIALSVLSGIWALPLTQEEGADSAEPSPNGCFVTKKDVRTYIVWKIDPVTGDWVARNETHTRLIRHCCDGYTGDECNERIDCGNLTCEEDSDVHCAVIKTCGREIQMFLDEEGLLSIANKCNQTVDVDSLSCSGVCAEDPCSQVAQCSAHPNATCFPIGCKCRAVWLEKDEFEESGESQEVNCEGPKVTSKRDAACKS